VFTGIVERVAPITRIEPQGGRVELEIEAGADLAGEVRIGDSVAISGCCLTVVAIRGGALAFQAVQETLRCTSLGSRKAGDALIERAMRADAGSTATSCRVTWTGRAPSGRSTPTERIAWCASTAPRSWPARSSPRARSPSKASRSRSSRRMPGIQRGAHPAHAHRHHAWGLAPRMQVNLELDVLGKYVLRYLETIGVARAGS
jgi:riboflavin synthase